VNFYLLHFLSLCYVCFKRYNQLHLWVARGKFSSRDIIENTKNIEFSLNRDIGGIS